MTVASRLRLVFGAVLSWLIAGSVADAAGHSVGAAMRPGARVSRPLPRAWPRGFDRNGFEMRQRRQSQAFGWAYGAPFYSGSFYSGPYQAPWGDDAQFGVPFGYPPPFAGPAPQPCVTPLVIVLRARDPRRKMPRIVYGSPNFCPPPVIARAP